MPSPRSLPHIWVVQAKGLDGIWRTYRSPSEPPFSRAEAERLRIEASKKYKNYEFRVVAYQETLVLVN